MQSHLQQQLTVEGLVGTEGRARLYSALVHGAAAWVRGVAGCVRGVAGCVRGVAGCVRGVAGCGPPGAPRDAT